MRLSIALALTMALLAAASGCRREAAPGATGAAASPPAIASARSPWQQAVDGFIAGWLERNPVAAASAGKHEFDGRLPDWSPGGLKANVAWLHSQRDAIVAFADDELDSVQRFQRDYVLAVIDGQLFWLEESGFPNTNPAFYAGDLSPSMYLTRPYAPLPTRMAAFVRYQEALPAAIAQIRANLRPRLPATYVELGENTFAGYASFFRDEVPAIFKDVADPALQARFRASNAAAVKATQEMAGWFAGLRPQATSDFALGSERFARMLQATERVDTPISELKAIGEADLQRNLEALRQACATYSPGSTLRACVDEANSEKPAGGAVEGARSQLALLRDFVRQKDLVSIPGPEQAQVAEAPPFNRWNFAYIEIPGPYEVNLPSVYYIAPPDPKWTPDVQAAYLPGRSRLLFVSAHEVWPGHFLQFLHSNRAEWKFGQLFVGYAFAEGWAHYAEEMMWDAGLGDGVPAVHIGQLSNALLRNARFLSAIGLHAGGMSVEESTRLFRDQGLQEEGTARQQAARGTFDPAYLNYTLGKLMIMQLREDWTASRGGRKAWRAFHDQLLSYGGPPIPLLRAQMLGGPAEAKLWSALPPPPPAPLPPLTPPPAEAPLPPPPPSS